jgi:acetolactate synthase-1/2/3 large subunit
VLDALGSARRPVLVVGLGARATPERDRLCAGVRRLAEAGLPVLSTYKGRGVLPDDSAASAGVVTGAPADAAVLGRADLVVGVGLDPVELLPAPWPYPGPVALLGAWAIDDSDYFGDRLAAEVVGDPAVVVEALADALDAGGRPGPGGACAQGWDDPAWATSRRSEIVAALLAAGPDGGAGLRPQDVVAMARRAAPAGTLATVDAGAHMLAAVPLWATAEPAGLLISNGLATMGFALPAAVAAALVSPGRRVVCFSGDGGLSMALGELETLARLDLPVVVVVFDDAALTLIGLKQGPGQGGDGAVRYAPVDYAAVGRAMGLAAERVADPAAFGRALEAALARPGPTLLDVVVDPSAYREIFDLVRSPPR